MGTGAVSGSSGSSQNMCVAPDDASAPEKTMEQKAEDIEKNGIHDLIEKGCQDDLKLPDSFCDIMGDWAQQAVDNAYQWSQQPSQPPPSDSPTGGQGGSDNTGGAGGGG